MKDGLKNLMCLLIIVGTITCFAACTYNDTVDESAADEALSTSVYSSADQTKSDDQEVK